MNDEFARILRMITAKEKILGHFRAQQMAQNRETPPSVANASREHDWKHCEFPAATPNIFAVAVRFE